MFAFEPWHSRTPQPFAVYISHMIFFDWVSPPKPQRNKKQTAHWPHTYALCSCTLAEACMHTHISQRCLRGGISIKVISCIYSVNNMRKCSRASGRVCVCWLVCVCVHALQYVCVCVTVCIWMVCQFDLLPARSWMEGDYFLPDSFQLCSHWCLRSHSLLISWQPKDNKKKRQKKKTHGI